MRFDTSQQMRLGQQMRLAPRMIQSMEILQLPMLALQERIEQELESNVALELADPAPADAADEDVREVADNGELIAGDDRDFERLSDFEQSFPDSFDVHAGPRPAAGERDGKLDAMNNTAARGEPLVDQLLHQWSFFDLEPDIAAAGRILIEYIDEDGLLSADLDEILEQQGPRPGLNLTRENLEAALREVQTRLEPAGVGARNTRELLLLQIEFHERDPEADDDWADAKTIVREHWDDLLQNRLPKIAQQQSIPLERVRRAVDQLRRLNLTPGRDVVDEDVMPIVPDVIVEYDEASEDYLAAPAGGLLPVLRIVPAYERMSRDRAQDAETRKFAGDSVKRAQWLIEAVHQRNNTLMRVMKVVLARQRDFFDYGPQHLKPMPMVDVADQLGVHVGTVSRAVAEKWVQTPRGLFPLRKFFSGGATTDSGEEMSWEAIKAQLKEIVDGEDKANPMSDEALAQALRDRGIDIARRTVVKYRSQLNIPPARLRKVH